MKQRIWKLGFIMFLVGSLAGCAHMGSSTAEEGLSVKTGSGPMIVVDNPMIKITNIVALLLLAVLASGRIV